MTRSQWMLLLTLSLLWGGSFFFVELALQGLPSLSIVWGRVAVAALILGAVLGLRGHLGSALPRSAWGAVLVMGLLNNVIPFTLFVLAQGRIDSGLAAIVNATTPLWTVVVAHLFTTDERIIPAKAAGLGFGFAGVVVMMGGASGEATAILACLGAALSYGLAGVWGRRFRRMGVAPLATAFGQTCAATLILTPIWLLIDQPWQMPTPAAGAVLAVVAMAALSTALAYLIYFRLLATAGATNLSLVTFLIPVSAAALGILFLGERLEPQHIIGFVLIAAGLMAMNGKTGEGRIGKWLERQSGADRAAK
jgi:drug/metabolite transporter (DMT)-like permease